MNNNSIEEFKQKIDYDSNITFIQEISQRYDMDHNNNQYVLDALNTIHEKEKDNSLYLGVVGEFSSGKSSLINSLVRDKLLQTDIIQATTAAPTLLKYGSNINVEIEYYDRRVEYYKKNFGINKLISSLSAFLKKDKNKKVNSRTVDFIDKYTTQEELAKSIYRVTIYYPFEVLKDGLVIVDTPGINAVNRRHSQVTEKAVHDICDAAIILIPSDAPLSQTLLNFIKDNLSDVIERCIFIVTKIDLIRRENQQKRLLDNISQRLKSELNLENIKIYSITTAGIIDDEYELTQKQKDNYLNQFLQTEKSVMDILKQQKIFIQIKKLSCLILEIMQREKEELIKISKSNETRCTYLLNNPKKELKSFIKEEKTISISNYEKEAFKYKSQIISKVNYMKSEMYKKLRNEIYLCKNKKELKKALKGSYSTMVETEKKNINNTIVEQLKQIRKVGDNQLNRFEERFLNSYKGELSAMEQIDIEETAYTQGLMNYFNNEHLKRREKIKKLRKTKFKFLGILAPMLFVLMVYLSGNISVTEFELISLFFSSIGFAIGFLIDVLIWHFVWPIDKAKENFWNDFQMVMDKSFTDLEERLVHEFNEINCKVHENLNFKIDKYISNNNAEAQRTIDKDKLEVANLKKENKLISEDLQQIDIKENKLKGWGV